MQSSDSLSNISVGLLWLSWTKKESYYFIFEGDTQNIHLWCFFINLRHGWIKGPLRTLMAVRQDAPVSKWRNNQVWIKEIGYQLTIQMTALEEPIPSAPPLFSPSAAEEGKRAHMMSPHHLNSPAVTPTVCKFQCNVTKLTWFRLEGSPRANLWHQRLLVSLWSFQYSWQFSSFPSWTFPTPYIGASRKFEAFNTVSFCIRFDNRRNTQKKKENEN